MIKSPCRDCLKRKPGCHDPEKCELWAAYAAACEAVREKRAEYARTWCYESGRDRNRTRRLKERQRRAAAKKG